MRVRAARSLALLGVVLLGGCAGLGGDGGPLLPRPGAGSVPDAVPRAEPPSRYGNPRSYVVNGRRYHTLRSSRGYRERGIASWYGRKFHGRRTSSGETYDMYAMTAAHRTLPLPSYVEVTNLENGRRAVVRVNDRGPFHEDRLIDLSYAAARKLGIVGHGTALVEVRALEPGAGPAPVAPVAARARLFVQAGAFELRANAERLRARLAAALGFPVEVSRFERGGRRLYRVRVGPLAGGEAAERAMLAIEGLAGARPRLVIE